MPRTGRPLTNDPKANRITVRFNASLFRRLEEYCKKTGTEKAEVIRLALEKFFESDK